MSYYKVTFAVESKALGATLETLALGIREGVISKSFVVEREEESLNPGVHVEEPQRIKADKPKLPKTPKIIKMKRRRASKGADIKHGQIGVIVDHVRVNGKSSYADIGRALAAAGFSRAGAGSAINRAIGAGVLRRDGLEYNAPEIAPAPEIAS
jgi:hypothetical protein